MRTLLRLSLPMRGVMVLAVVLICALGRLSQLWSRSEWQGSTGQAQITIVVLWLVIPTFAAMLGASLLHGEHGPWSWAMARPVSRWRFVSRVLALDVATVATALFAAWLVLGGYGGAWLELDIGVRQNAWWVVFVANVPLYVGAALGGAWASTRLRGAAIGVAWTAAYVVAAPMLLSWGHNLGELLLQPSYVRHIGGTVSIRVLLAIFVLAAATAGTLGAVRTVRALPHVTWRAWLLPSCVGLASPFVAAAALVCIAWAAAPPEVRLGDHSVVVDTRLPFVVHAWDGPERVELAYTTPIRRLSAGNYELCLLIAHRKPLSDGTDHFWGHFEQCARFEVRDEVTHVGPEYDPKRATRRK